MKREWLFSNTLSAKFCEQLFVAYMKTTYGGPVDIAKIIYCNT